MTTVTLQQAFEACQTNKNIWLKRKAELADLEREYREQLLAGDEQIPRRMQDLRDNIDVKKWEINQAPVAISAHMRRCSTSASATGSMTLCSSTARSWPPRWHLS